jgi:hypothetical protein
VFVGVGVKVIVGVELGSGVSEGLTGVLVGVADKIAKVCIADQVLAAMVSGASGWIGVIALPKLHAITTKKANILRRAFLRWCLLIVAS